MIGTYVGPPGNLLTAPKIDPGVDNPFDIGLTITELAAGGVGTQRNARARRAWAWTMSNRTDRQLAQLLDLYQGAYGPGPYLLVDPLWTNVLPLDITLMGARLVSPGTLPDGGIGWDAATGTIALSTAVALPTAAPGPAGMLQWTGAGASSYLFAGPEFGMDTSWQPPAILTEPACFSFFARTASGSASVSARLAYGSASAYVGPSAAGSTTVLSTTWQRLSVIVGVGGWPAAAAYIVPYLFNHNAAAPTIYIARPQLEYADAPSDWDSGKGAPRVLPVSAFGHRVPQSRIMRSASIMFAEV